MVQSQIIFIHIILKIMNIIAILTTLCLQIKVVAKHLVILNIAHILILQIMIGKRIKMQIMTLFIWRIVMRLP